jgi:hypothetical protein
MYLLQMLFRKGLLKVSQTIAITLVDSEAFRGFVRRTGSVVDKFLNNSQTSERMEMMKKSFQNQSAKRANTTANPTDDPLSKQQPRQQIQKTYEPGVPSSPMVAWWQTFKYRYNVWRRKWK